MFYFLTVELFSSAVVGVLAKRHHQQTIQHLFMKHNRLNI
jgi:hypothetical protein